MNLDDLILHGALLAVAASVAVLVWVLGRAVAAVPAENREFRDPPPLEFRCLWWPIRFVAHAISPLLGDRHQEAIARRLRLAGWEFCLLPAQWVSARVVYAGLFGALASWMASTLVPTASSASAAAAWGLVGCAMGAALPAVWLRDRIAARRARLLRSLPFCLDIITLCVEAGLNFQGALAQAVAKGPTGVLRDELQRCLRDMRAGKPRAEALKALAERLGEPAVTQFVSAVVQAEAMGMNLGPVLRAQADQRRAERFLRAEKLAMQAPVKMLLPLIGFIFPCTFIVLFFPIAMKLLDPGV
jgi:tight adherence protein C